MADENRTLGELSSGAEILGYHTALPFSPEAEQSVLGAILLDSSCLDRVAEILPRPDYFHQVNNSLIYGAMLEMFTLGQPVDFVTVLEKLKESKSLYTLCARKSNKALEIRAHFRHFSHTGNMQTLPLQRISMNIFIMTAEKVKFKVDSICRICDNR